MAQPERLQKEWKMEKAKKEEQENLLDLEHKENYIDGEVVWIKVISVWWPGFISFEYDKYYAHKKRKFYIIWFFNEEYCAGTHNRRNIRTFHSASNPDFIQNVIDGYPQTSFHRGRYQLFIEAVNIAMSFSVENGIAKYDYKNAPITIKPPKSPPSPLPQQPPEVLGKTRSKDITRIKSSTNESVKLFGTSSNMKPVLKKKLAAKKEESLKQKLDSRKKRASKKKPVSKKAKRTKPVTKKQTSVSDGNVIIPLGFKDNLKSVVIYDCQYFPVVPAQSRAQPTGTAHVNVTLQTSNTLESYAPNQNLTIPITIGNGSILGVENTNDTRSPSTEHDEIVSNFLSTIQNARIVFDLPTSQSKDHNEQQNSRDGSLSGVENTNDTQSPSTEHNEIVSKFLSIAQNARIIFDLSASQSKEYTNDTESLNEHPYEKTLSPIPTFVKRRRIEGNANITTSKQPTSVVKCFHNDDIPSTSRPSIRPTPIAKPPPPPAAAQPFSDDDEPSTSHAARDDLTTNNDDDDVGNSNNVLSVDKFEQTNKDNEPLFIFDSSDDDNNYNTNDNDYDSDDEAENDAEKRDDDNDGDGNVDDVVFFNHSSNNAEVREIFQIRQANQINLYLSRRLARVEEERGIHNVRIYFDHRYDSNEFNSRLTNYGFNYTPAATAAAAAQPQLNLTNNMNDGIEFGRARNNNGGYVNNNINNNLCQAVFTAPFVREYENRTLFFEEFDCYDEDDPSYSNCSYYVGHNNYDTGNNMRPGIFTASFAREDINRTRYQEEFNSYDENDSSFMNFLYNGENISHITGNMHPENYIASFVREMSNPTPYQEQVNRYDEIDPLFMNRSNNVGNVNHNNGNNVTPGLTVASFARINEDRFPRYGHEDEHNRNYKTNSSFNNCPNNVANVTNNYNQNSRSRVMFTSTNISRVTNNETNNSFVHTENLVENNTIENVNNTGNNCASYANESVTPPYEYQELEYHNDDGADLELFNFANDDENNDIGNDNNNNNNNNNSVINYARVIFTDSPARRNIFRPPYHEYQEEEYNNDEPYPTFSNNYTNEFGNNDTENVNNNTEGEEDDVYDVEYTTYFATQWLPVEPDHHEHSPPEQYEDFDQQPSTSQSTEQIETRSSACNRIVVKQEADNYSWIN